MPAPHNEVVVELDEDWSFVVNGLVENPVNLTIGDLLHLSSKSIKAELYCVADPDTPVTDGKWVGVELKEILRTAKPLPNAIKIAFYASDGYTTDLTLEEALNGDVLIAYAKDGNPLMEKLRLVVPGRWGYKWIHHLVRIELVDYDFKGVWENAGYSDSAVIPRFNTTYTR